MKIKEKVEFQVEITLNKCPTDLTKFKRTISINPKGLDERITIDVEPICGCDCENERNINVKTSSFYYFHHDFQ